jgi:hypothetical protein
VAADHGGEEQRNQYPTNKLSLEHGDILCCEHAFLLCDRVDISRGSTARKWRAT